MQARMSEKTPLLGYQPASTGSFLRLRKALLRSASTLAALAVLVWLAWNSKLSHKIIDKLAFGVGKEPARWKPEPSSSAFRSSEHVYGDDMDPVTWETTPFNPTSIPLAARAPYLNVWLESGNRARRGLLTSQYAAAFNGNWLPWVVGVLVDGRPFNCMSTSGLENGLDGQAEQISMSFTPSSTTFVMRAGPVDLALEFLSPITPNDLVRQTLPYSYLTISAKSNDGGEHDLQLYTDIDAKFVSNDWDAQCVWNTTEKDGLIYHQVSLKHQIRYGEFDDFTSDGSVVYATSPGEGVTFASGPGPVVRKHFQEKRSLANSSDTNYRQIGDNKPAFAFAKDFGKIGAKSSPSFRLSIGRYRSPAISWTATEGPYPDRDLYYHVKLPSLHESLSFFHDDFNHVSEMAAAVFGNRVKEAASAISSKYYGLVAIAARQCFVGTEVSVGKTNTGEYNASDIMSFTKEIATSNFVSTVDIIYPAFPFFLYAGDDILKSLMEPILRYTASGKYPNPWCLHDLGYKYPNATGHDAGDDEAMFIEESAGMLIMGGAYVMATRDTSQLMQYYDVFRGWAAFLETEALYPRDQVSSDDFAGNLINSTNLAVKGIVGIGAMAKLAEAVGKEEDAAHFQSTASRFVGEFLKMALSSDGTHVKLTYQDSDDTWVLLYHLFGDKLLGLKLFPDWLYAIQERWYMKVKERFGVRLDTRSDFAKSDWQIMAAAAHASNPEVRDIFIDGVYDYLEYGTSRQPFPDAYRMENEEPLAFIARPVVGAVYSLLALERLEQARKEQGQLILQRPLL